MNFLILLCLLAFVSTNIVVYAISNQEQSLRSTHTRKLRTCGSSEVPPCRVRAPRDIVFLVDASDSMDPLAFYGIMLDYVQDLWCTLNVNDLNRGAIITFGGEVKTRVPLREYTQDEWFEAVETLRADSTACCECCTPTAEAFRAARLTFQNNPSPDVSGVPIVRICFVITDGDPWQNPVNRPNGLPNLNPNEYWLWPQYEAAYYRYTIVPQEANRLKNLAGDRNVRIMLVGVPNKQKQPPEQGYFSGIPDPRLGKGKTQCITRAQRTDCVDIKFPPFPIISHPIEKNLFNADEWSVNDLIADTVDDLCEILPTGNPTTTPSAAPSTSSPTASPSTSPTRTPSHHPTFSPTRRPTQLPSKSPSSSPTKRPTNRPTQLPSVAPTTSRPSASPTETERFDGLDLFVFVDRSKSMRWRAADCRRAEGANIDADDDKVCWELFLYFVTRLVYRSTELKYDGERAIGWQDMMTDKSKGLRVWIYGFACSNGQSVPLTFRIAEKVNNAADFEAAIAEARLMTPDGGTCPGAAIERAVSQIMVSDLVERPYKAALLLTDGVFYDQPRPEKASKGLSYFGVLTYALGISIPEKGDNRGLKPKEIKDQKRQLAAFVNFDETRVKNFGVSGINILDQIARSFVEQIPVDVAKHFPRIWVKPYWCGFSNNEKCESTDPSTFPSYYYCKWIPNKASNPTGNGKCVDRCPYKAYKKCIKDKSCEWVQSFCRPKILSRLNKN